MPDDVANKETEARIKYLERRLKREYEKAARNVETKFEKMTADFAKKDAEKRRQMQYGLINEDEYNAWRKRKIAEIERLENMADELATEYVHANETARAIVAGEMPAIYAENHNFATWEAEEYGRINTGYTLYNPETIGILMADDPTLLPLPSKKKLAELAEKDLLWNKQLVSSAIMQGILQGESVNKMARRVAQATGEKNYHAAVRNARTMSTMVQNKAREDAFKRAKDRGSDIKQMWLATLDGRTRHAHRQLDRQVREVGEPFEVDGYEIAYPADPAAPAYLVYNCRCTVRGVIGGLELMASKTLDYSQLGGQSYEEWKEGQSELYKKKTRTKR